MGDAERFKRMANLPLQVNTFPRDLLQRFMESSSNTSTNWRESNFSEAKEEELESESAEIELNLGLSLGGRYGVEKSTNSLLRSSSIAGPLHILGDDAVLKPAAAGCTGLVRTASLPVEMEDEWRKRKEMQSLRRMKAKRRRSEKQRVLKGEKDAAGGCSGGEFVANLRGMMERDQYVSAMKRVGSSVAPQFSLPMWAAAATASKGIFGGDVGTAGGGGLQGSIESQGGSTSSMSELECKPLQGSSSCGEEKEQTNNDTTAATAAAGSSRAKTKENTSTAEAESPSERSNVPSNRGKETGANSLGDMPCVFTKGDGPNGRRIDGILYKYGKGEEVKIMCVCHGSFHSPAEFIKHAGGTDMANPLKHIVVNPNSSF